MNINVDGINTNYVCQGEGDALLILPGWSATSPTYNIMIKQLSSKYKVYVLDLPGFGITPEPNEPWCVDDYADFVSAFIDALNIKKLTLIGHSFGGRIIIKLLNRDNDFEVVRVGLVDSAGIKSKMSEGQSKRQAKYKKLKKIYSGPFMKKLFPNALEKLQNKYGSRDYAAASPIMKQCLVKAVNEDLTDLIPHIKQQTMLIWGKNDTATPFSDAMTMNKLISNSKLIGIDGAGHFPFIDAPFEFRRAIDECFINC